MSGLDEVQRVIVVLSGKGGVGKSTVAAQFALCLSKMGLRVGLLDIDLCGPSIPRMFGIDKTSSSSSSSSTVFETSEGMTPIEVLPSKLKLMSMALLLDNPNDAIIWRGPRKTAMIQRLLTGVKWSNLDYLIIDTPPGTSDEHIAVMTVLKAQERAKDFLRAVLVTTPQMLSINDVRREITFCHKTSFEILGLIENMSGYVCPHCSECTNVFAQGGGKYLAEQYSICFLGSLPIDNRLNSIFDQGIEQINKSDSMSFPYEIIGKFGRSESEEKNPKTFLVQKLDEKQKGKFVLQLVDLEKLNNLSEFIKDLLWYKQLNHSNLMSLKDCFLIDTKLFLIKPFASFGSCADLLTRFPSGIPEALIALIIFQLVQALRYLHDRHILHRGITSKTIYLCDNGRVLLDNFASCISMISPFDGKLRRQIHEFTDKLEDQITYLAPEMIYQNSTGYNLKSDVYSLGTVACELANGSHTYVDMPFGHLSMLYAKVQGSEPILLDQTQLTDEMIALTDENCSEYVDEIKKRRYSKEFHSFVRSCVATKIEQRFSAEELQTHPFLKSAKKICSDAENLSAEIVKFLGSKGNEIKRITDGKIDSFIGNSSRSHSLMNISWEF